MRGLSNKVAVVTGGASGIGAAIARRFTQEGARVFITDIQEPAGAALARELNATFLPHDVASPESWRTVIDQIEAQAGKMHFLVNNAGIAGAFANADPETTRIEDWRMVNRVNVEGVFLGCQTAIPLIRATGGGAITNFSSTAALSPTPEFIAYGASKAAVAHMTKSVASHCANNRYNIRCNSVHPSIIITPMFTQIADQLGQKRQQSGEAMTKAFQANLPQGESPAADDVASAVMFLSSDEARFITGTSMVIGSISPLG